MSKYDLPEEKEQPPECPHNFNKSTIIQTEYTDDLCDMIIEYGRQGYNIDGFAGRYNICVNSLCEWLSQPEKYPQFDSAVKIAQSAVIHYLNEELQHNIKLGDWQAVANIKAIINECMKAMPKRLTDNMYNNLKLKTPEQLEEEKRFKDLKMFQGNVTGE